MSFKGENDKTRLDVFIQVPYNSVQFVKTAQGFEAAYTLTVSVYDEEKKNLFLKHIDLSSNQLLNIIDDISRSGINIGRESGHKCSNQPGKDDAEHSHRYEIAQCKRQHFFKIKTALG